MNGCMNESVGKFRTLEATLIFLAGQRLLRLQRSSERHLQLRVDRLIHIGRRNHLAQLRLLVVVRVLTQPSRHQRVHRLGRLALLVLVLVLLLGEVFDRRPAHSPTFSNCLPIRPVYVFVGLRGKSSG